MVTHVTTKQNQSSRGIKVNYKFFQEFELKFIPDIFALYFSAI